jgi:hypothetical protein
MIPIFFEDKKKIIHYTKKTFLQNPNLIKKLLIYKNPLYINNKTKREGDIKFIFSVFYLQYDVDL